MRGRYTDPTFEDLQEIARRIEELVGKANQLLFDLASIKPGETLNVFAEAEARLLRFDKHGKEAFYAALEEKRVRTLAQDNLIMTCVLSAAVALSQFKSAPRHVGGPLTKKALSRLRERSTNVASLSAFALTVFYTVMGQGALGHLQARLKRKTLQAK